MNNIGKFIDAGIGTGADSVSNIQYEISEEKLSRYKLGLLEKASATAKNRTMAILKPLG